MLSPSDVLRMQVSLAEALNSPENTSAKSLDGLAFSEGLQHENDTTTSAFAANHVRNARAYQVTEEMGALVQARFESLHHIPATTHCPTDIAPPRTAGFVVMEEPIAFLDVRESVNLAHALVWGPATVRVTHSGPTVSGWALTAWNDISRRADDVSIQMVRDYPHIDRLLHMRWWPATALFLSQDQRVGQPYFRITGEDREKAERRFPEFKSAPPAVAEQVPNLFRYWLALWQLFTEERGPAIAETTHPQRPALRLARRVLQTSDITVITLRKRPGAHTGTGTPLDHQVPVTEHYRSYLCRQPDGTLAWEKRKIREHLRGPHGTPLIVRKKMERLSR